MDFAYTAAQSELYDKVYSFARAQLNEDVLARDRERRFPAREWNLCGEFGLLGLCIPERYGGMGLGHLSTAIALEALGRGCEDMGLVFAIAAHQLAVAKPISDFGTDAVKERVLPKLCNGEWVGANAITEAEAGSDVFRSEITLTAHRVRLCPQWCEVVREQRACCTDLPCLREHRAAERLSRHRCVCRRT